MVPASGHPPNPPNATQPNRTQPKPAGFKAYGLADGTTCLAAFDPQPAAALLGVAPQGECSTRCGGDQQQACGGDGSFDLFLVGSAGSSLPGTDPSSGLGSVSAAYLGVRLSGGFSSAAGRGAYRTLAQAWHPVHGPVDTRHFIVVRSHWPCLSWLWTR